MRAGANRAVRAHDDAVVHGAPVALLREEEPGVLALEETLHVDEPPRGPRQRQAILDAWALGIEDEGATQIARAMEAKPEPRPHEEPCLPLQHVPHPLRAKGSIPPQPARVSPVAVARVGGEGR